MADLDMTPGVHGEWEQDDPPPHVHTDACFDGDLTLMCGFDHLGRPQQDIDDLLQQAQQTVIVQRPLATPARPWSRKFPVKCPECGDVLLSSSLNTHRKLHGVRVAHTTALLNSLRYDGPYTPKPGRRPTVKKVTDIKKERANRGINPSSPTLGRVPKTAVPPTLDHDEFITTVLSALFPSGVPIKDMRATMRWAEVTKEFLKDIEG